MVSKSVIWMPTGTDSLEYSPEKSRWTPTCPLSMRVQAAIARVAIPIIKFFNNVFIKQSFHGS